MNQELPQKVIEHNRGSMRLKQIFSMVGLVASPLSVLLGIVMLVFPNQIDWPVTLWSRFYVKTALCLIAIGGYCTFLSIKWLLRHRSNPSA